MVHSKIVKENGVLVIDICNGQISDSNIHYDEIPEPSSLRSVLKYAGCRIAVETDELVFSCGNMFSIHACSNGKKKVHIQNSNKLTEYFSGEIIEVIDNLAEIEMKKGETKIFVCD